MTSIKTNTHFQSPFIQTPTVARPLPSTGPVSVEYSSVEEIPSDAKCGVGFSAGNDSLVATHKAMSEGYADFVVHIDTGTNLAESISYVRDVCERYGWPLFIAPTTESAERYFCRFGAPDQRGHNSAFHTLKGRALREIDQHLGDFELVTGVFKRESTKRMVNVSGEYSDPEYVSWAYRNIVWDWVESDFERYIKEHDLPKSPTKEKVHRSGDCQCLAFGHRDEIYVDIEAKYPNDFEYLRNIERRMQEYRGRLLRVEDEHPEVYTQARDDWRKRDGKPFMTLDMALERFAPEVFEWALSLERIDAIRRGRQIASNYLGYGALTDAEEHGLVKQAEIEDGVQADLCEYCGDLEPNEPLTVKRAVKEARE